MAQKPSTKKKKVPYSNKPESLSVDEWQMALRQQFAETQKFKIKNLGDHPVFSDFEVYNPISNKHYKVAIRNKDAGLNYCSCPDFKVNELGTCKHVEFVLQKLQKNTRLRKYWKEGIVRSYSSMSLKYGKERQVFLRIGSNHTDKIQEIASAYFNPEGFLKPEAIFFIEGFFEQVKNLDPHFKVYPDAMDFIIDQRDQEKRQTKISALLPDGADSQYFDDLISAKLYPYQKEGIIFAAKTGRAVLADDMGLGKTIQAIASAELLAKEFGISQVLVICPTSLKYQWKSEIERFTDRSIMMIEGGLDKRKQQYQSDDFYKIASYGVALNDLDYLNQMAPDLVILDEAQRIKNWKTKTAQNLKKLKSDFAFILTGTPLENRLEELHSLIEFVDPYKLGALFRFLDQHQIKDEVGKVVGYQNLNSISQTLSDVLIRRTRTETLEQLPERTSK
ncbi:MAG: SNF2-related protein, partial [Bacteroidota bacterium]|nr:SNF2-related protein [Bacteroidota bacterium]